MTSAAQGLVEGPIALLSSQSTDQSVTVRDRLILAIPDIRPE